LQESARVFENKSHGNVLSGGGGAIRPVEESERGEALWKPTVEPRLRPGPEIKDGRCITKYGMPKRLGCEAVKNELSQILQFTNLLLLPFYIA